MITGRRWTVHDGDGNPIYLTQERGEHIVDGHPEMEEFEEELKEIIRRGRRKQEALQPQKYRYSLAFDYLVEYNTHIVAVVHFRDREDLLGRRVPNNHVVTAYQKEMG